MDHPDTNPAPFNRQTVRTHRDRAAADFDQADFLFRESGNRLLDRLIDVKRNFTTALDLGCHTGTLAKALTAHPGIEHVVQCDLSTKMAHGAKSQNAQMTLVCDEETLAFKDQSFDLVTSNLSLHWVNDLPGTLLQIRRTLKPDGLFLCAMLGGGTLDELRQSLLAGEIETVDGASPRVSPFVDPHDAGALLQRAGFALPVVDTDRIVLSYADPFAMMAELRGMGEGNAVAARRRNFTPRAVIEAGARNYYQNHSDGDGRIPATFQIVTLTGWAPHESQQQPMARGSGQTPLSDVLG